MAIRAVAISHSDPSCQPVVRNEGPLLEQVRVTVFKQVRLRSPVTEYFLWHTSEICTQTNICVETLAVLEVLPGSLQPARMHWVFVHHRNPGPCDRRGIVGLLTFLTV
jgi:hypothetical protein